MMIPKRNLRKRVVLGEKTNQDLEFKKSVTKEKDQNKKYNLRKTDKLDGENENHNLKINEEKPCMVKSAADVSNFQSKNNDVNKENKAKLRGKRQVLKLIHSPKIKSRVSKFEVVEKRYGKNSKIGFIPCNVPIWRKNLPSNPEKIPTQKKNFDIYDISQDEDMSHIVRGLSKKVKRVSKKSGKSVKRFFTKNIVSKKGLKSTREKPEPNPNQCKTIKSDEPKTNPSCNALQAKGSQVPLQTDGPFTEQLNLPEPFVETEDHIAEPLNLEGGHPKLTCYDATTILVTEQLNPPEAFDETEINIAEPVNLAGGHPELTCYDATTILLNVADDFEKSLLHPRMTSTPDNAAMATVPPKNGNNLILNDISHIASNNRNIVQVVIDTPDMQPAKKASKGFADVTLFKLPEPRTRKPTLFPQKPVPKMTSTPYTAAIAAIPSENNILNDISHIPSSSRDIVKVVIDTPDPLPPKKSSKRRADVTLFESPEHKKKNPARPKSPQKSVQMNLIDHFLSSSVSSPEKSLEDSVKKPNRAYHSPDNFKTHLARAKRASEVMRMEKKKSKEDLLIEQMAKHFEEVSGMELCIE